MNVLATPLPGVLLIEPRVLEDQRGALWECYHERRFAEIGIAHHFVQDNHSRSVPGTLRGLHYQLENPQGKLVRCVRGSIVDVAVDIRRGSPSFGKWIAVELSENNKRELYIPPGYAHGFCAPRYDSDVVYKCTQFYDAADDHGVPWNDPLLNIAWPLQSPRLSERDARFAPLTEERDDLPVYRSP